MLIGRMYTAGALHLKKEVGDVELYAYLQQYSEIEDIRLYHGTDTHPKSQAFLQKAAGTGYNIITKPVKYVAIESGVHLRKCDFDMEVCIDVHRAIADGVVSFIFFTGDGDYEPLYKMLITMGKQVIVVYASGHLGKEVWDIRKGIFKTQYKHLGISP